MPSAKILEKKQAECAELTEKIKNATAGVLVSYTGITVEQDTQLRKALREAGVHYVVMAVFVSAVAGFFVYKFIMLNKSYKKIEEEFAKTGSIEISNF